MIVSVLLAVGSLNLNDIVLAQRHIWFCVPMFPMFIVFFISALAETNRAPFDLPKGRVNWLRAFLWNIRRSPLACSFWANTRT